MRNNTIDFATNYKPDIIPKNYNVELANRLIRKLENKNKDK